MSFGWSIGDLVAAIKLLAEVATTLDDVDGASSEYQEGSRFLRSLIHTVEPLKNLDNVNLTVSYKDEICSEVEAIRVPVEEFLMFVKKYEAGLGAQAPVGMHRNIRRKLQWHFGGDLKKLEKLQVRIGRHMTTLDTLLKRLTIDLITNTQMNLPSQLRTAFTEVLDGRLQSEFREELLPIQEHLLELRDNVSKGHQALLQYLEQNQLITTALDTVLRSIMETQTKQIAAPTVPTRSAQPLIEMPPIAPRTEFLGDCQVESARFALDREKYSQKPLSEFHILQTGQFRAAMHLHTRLKQWWSHPMSQFLWVQEPLNTNISYIASSVFLTAGAASVPVTGYLNECGLSGEAARHDPHTFFLRMIYSMIFQLASNVIKSSDRNHELSNTWIEDLDGSLLSLPIAFSTLEKLICTSTEPQLIVTDVLHLIDRGTDATLKSYILKLLEVLRQKGAKQETGRIQPLIKVLIVTPGQTLTLLNAVEWDEKLDLTKGKAKHHLPLVAELEVIFRNSL